MICKNRNIKQREKGIVKNNIRTGPKLPPFSWED